MAVIDRWGIEHQYRGGSKAKPRIALTTDDIAELLGVTRQTVYDYISRGKLKFTGDGARDFRSLAVFLRNRNQLFPS